MIKQIWTVRNPQKLFTGLAFAIAGLILGYTVMNLMYLPMENTGLLEYARLLATPLLSLSLCVLWFFLIKRNTVLFGCKAAADDTALSRQKKLARDCRLTTMMLITVALAFVQLELLNQAKQLSGFGLLPSILCVLALVIASLRFRAMIRTCRR